MTGLDMTSEDGQTSYCVIDVHTHFMPNNLPNFSSRYGYSGFTSLSVDEDGRKGTLKKRRNVSINVPSAFWNIEERKEFMRLNGIDVQVLVPPASLFSYWAKSDDTADLCRIVNNSMKQEADKYPQSFVPLFIVPMQAPELAVAEVQRCINLGFKGCAIGAHVNEWNLDATELIPFWEICEEHEIAIFIHSNDVKVTRKDRQYWLNELIGAPHEMNRAVATALLGGVFEQFPKLKICFTDGGGSFPYLQGRIEQGFQIMPDLCATETDLSPNTFLDKFMCDSVVGSAHALELLVKVMGPKNVVFGSNFPLYPTTMLGDSKEGEKFQSIDKNFVNKCELTSEDRSLILAGNAMKLFNLTK